jgi:ribonuclease HI
VKNQDLWGLLHHMSQMHDISWQWLRGHAGHPLNERADRLATEARASLPRSPKAMQGHQVRGEGWPSVEVYVKASCHGAQGPGGWGAILRTGERSRTLSGREQSTTANAMLIRGATRALQALNRPCQVTLYSDAKYLVLGASQWVQGWQARGWRTREDKPVANQAEWQALLEAARPHAVTWLLVQGDAGSGELEQAGELASQAANLQKAEPLA